MYLATNRESCADILTVRRMVSFIEALLTPRKEGSTKFVQLGSDQPSYKMFCDVWLASWGKSNGYEGFVQINETTMPSLHEWMIPVPGWFHGVKQLMHTLCM